MIFKYTKNELNYLKSKNNQMKMLIEHYGFIKREIYSNSFEALICIIIEQQIATKTAKNIINRIKQKYHINYDTFSTLDDHEIISFGISQRKLATIKSIIELFKSNNNRLILEGHDNQLIFDLLIPIKGIGPWSIQSYIMFYKCDLNVFLEKDLVLDKAAKDLNIMDFSHQTYTPYNTIAAFYLWAFGNSTRYGITFNSIVGNITIIEENNVIISIGINAEQLFKAYETDNLRTAKKEILQYLDGSLDKFTFNYHYNASPFQTKVYQIIEKLPYGQTLTYSQLANAIGSPKSARAVGNALNKNPLLFVLPCHRIVAKSNIGGFVYGGDIKSKLLKIEGYSNGN